MPAPLEEGAASQPSGLNVEGNGPRLVVPEGSINGKISSPEAQMASLGLDAMGAGEFMGETLGNTEDGPEHEGTGADELMERHWEALRTGLRTTGRSGSPWSSTWCGRPG